MNPLGYQRITRMNFNALFNREWNNLLLGTDLEENSQILTTSIENIIKEYTCKFSYRKKKKHSINLMKERDHGLRISLKSKLRHWFNMLRNCVVKKLRKTKADFFLTIINEARVKPIIIWNQLKLTGKHNEDRNILELKVIKQSSWSSRHF